MRINIFFIENAEVVATVRFERYKADACIFGVVVGKVNYLEELSLIILLVINKNPKVGFHHTILSLSLAGNLRMKGSQELLLDFQKVT